MRIIFICRQTTTTGLAFWWDWQWKYHCKWTFWENAVFNFHNVGIYIGSKLFMQKFCIIISWVPYYFSWVVEFWHTKFISSTPAFLFILPQVFYKPLHQMLIQLGARIICNGDIRTASSQPRKINYLIKVPLLFSGKRGVKFKLFCLSLPMYLYCHSRMKWSI